MNVGNWYSAELEKLGVKEPGVEVQVDSSHPEYKHVRALGVDVDLRAQELMVLMARQSISSDVSADKTVDEKALKGK